MAFTSTAAQQVDPPLQAPVVRDSSPAPRVPWYAPLASLAIPGLGQAILNQNRALPYIAVEVYAVIEYRSQLTEAKRGRGRYQLLADDVARRFFGTAAPTGQFEYYESMEKFVESGAFDRVPGGDVDPEIDESTFNGSIWKLARQTYWNDPSVPPPIESAAYSNAVSLYLQRAVRSDFRWSWRDAALEHDLYRRSIRRSNDAFRRARQQLGILLANHLLSMADAFATVRVRYPARSGSSWMVTVELPFPHRD
jgi:hypothetical protein